MVPLCVVLAWMMGQPLDLNFNEFEALVLFTSVLLAAIVVQVSRAVGGWDSSGGRHQVAVPGGNSSYVCAATVCGCCHASTMLREGAGVLHA